MRRQLNILLALIFFTISLSVSGQTSFTPEDLLSLKRSSTSAISPDGKEAIISIGTPRTANEKAGSMHQKYYRVNLKSGEQKELFAEGIKGSKIKWSPDGKYISFLYSSDKGPRQVYAMPAEGGEMFQITNFELAINDYQWSPTSKEIAFLSKTPKSKKEKELSERGYGFIFYEENLKNTNLYTAELDANLKQVSTKQLTEGMNVWSMVYDKKGSQLAFHASPKNLIDHKYAFIKIHVLDINSGKVTAIVDHQGKKGNYVFSPDGKQIAFTAALNKNDHAVSQVFTYEIKSNKITNLTPENFKGHVTWVNWKSSKELLILSGEGVNNTINRLTIKNGKRKLLLNSEKSGVVFGTPLVATSGKHFVMSGSSPYDASNIYFWNGKSDLKKITDINPELKNKTLAKQEVFKFEARDGLEIEGLLMKPVSYKEGEKYPLIVYVHGGPESHHSNSWLSRYSTPGQVMANNGYLVAYVNYRASTGYGVDFAKHGLGDPAGKEFDDLADAIEFLIKEKGADANRVGMAGGSYGGYASGWFATRYTEYVKAVCMFVGVSNVISKRGTTDIPYEELYVHSGKPVEEQWQMNLERSPVYWAHQSKTATLIYGGADDPRVHPTQSVELFRRMKMNDHPAVRLVQYPGEGHGNRKQVGQIDVLYRQIDWLNWYVRDLKPLDGEMPALDISDKYGLDW